jgi:hypothetical protein
VQRVELAPRERSQRAGREGAERDRPERDPHELVDAVADRFAETAHDVPLPTADADLQPRLRG